MLIYATERWNPLPEITKEIKLHRRRLLSEGKPWKQWERISFSTWWSTAANGFTVGGREIICHNFDLIIILLWLHLFISPHPPSHSLAFHLVQWKVFGKLHPPLPSAHFSCRIFRDYWKYLGTMVAYEARKEFSDFPHFTGFCGFWTNALCFCRIQVKNRNFIFR